MATVPKEMVVNDVVVLDYSAGDYADYLKKKAEYEKDIADYYNSIERIETQEPPKEPEIKNALEGLRIMDVNVQSQTNLTKSPIETGVHITDSKVRMPIRVSIKAICDNLRGELETTKDTRSNIDVDIPIIGGAINSVSNGVVDTVMGYEFETKQKILTMARGVYANIQKMLNDKTRVNGRPKTWIVSTKGAIYQNMTLQSVDQLNDAEHLMVIPVTLNFEELILVGDDEKDSVFLSDDDSPLEISGSLKKGNIFEETWNTVKKAFS